MPPITKRTVPWQEVMGADGEKIFAVGGAIGELVYNASHAAGPVTLTSAVVPAGTLWVVTSVFCENVSNNSSYLYTYITTATAQLKFMGIDAVVKLRPVTYQGQLVLFPGDYLECVFGGTLLNDNVQMAYAGYSMTIP